MTGRFGFKEGESQWAGPVGPGEKLNVSDQGVSYRVP
jgi:hypothetical protein